MPSPVTATTLPLSFKPATKQYLSYGLDLAKTSNLSLILSNYSALATVSTLTSCPYSAFEYFGCIFISYIFFQKISNFSNC